MRATKLKRLYVEITNRCNMHCSFCSGTRRPPCTMTTAQYERVMASFAPLKPQVYLHILGEPLMHPELASILDITHRYGMVVNITTNGSMLHKVGDLLISHPAVRKVSISMHCLEGRKDDYAREYLDKIAEFGLKAAREGDPIVNYRMWTGGEDCLAQQNEYCVRYLVSKFGGVWADSYMSGYNSFNLADKVYICYDSQFEWTSLDRAEVAQYGKCLGGRDMLGVLADGEVVPCCLDSEGIIGLGNIFSEDIADILSSDRYIALRDGFCGARISEELCRKCTYRLRFDKASKHSVDKD